MSQTFGERFALAVAAKEHEVLRQLLHPQLDFRAMTPHRVWDAQEPGGVLAALDSWFATDDHIDAVETLELDAFADRERVGYRLRVSNPDGRHLVEQQAYMSARDDHIACLRIMRSGYRPVG